MPIDSGLSASLRCAVGGNRTFPAGFACLMAACASHHPGGVTYPLQQCRGTGEAAKHCVAELFADDTLLATREQRGFPRYYLEIADTDVRKDYCRENFPQPGQNDQCLKRLDAVADYFNPDGLPGADDLAVALEGGGTKAAPFGIGVLAGLDELGLLQQRVKAIASISGGSYAASYYYNRLYDLHEQGEVFAGNHVAWFRSCVPDYFSRHFEATVQQRCDKRGPLPWCGESNVCEPRHEEGFDPDYEFLGHVWTNADLLQGASEGTLDTSSAWGVRDYGNIGLLAIETGVTIPFHFVARSVFRWPLNSAPTKLAYKLGLEREYGYSPRDWKAAGDNEAAHFWDTTLRRRKDRTISGVAALTAGKSPLQPPPPLWIIGTTAPGQITGLEWLQAAARDPLRQQFEIAPYGYGSGTYGYARQEPDAPFDFFGRNPSGLPILDAVVASGAFLDEDETQISAQPLHLVGGTLLHFGNLTWFTEIPNFNVSDGTRLLEHATPWPLYLIDTNRLRRSPYIHLQDGGNTENSGIFPLLRRGYKTIIYAHETQDTQAELASICHLKNQLELDGSYVLISPDLERLVAPDRAGGGAPEHQGRPGGFKTYLDGLCSNQLDGTDLAAFDQNPKRDAAQRDPAVARLYCARLGYKPGVPFKPCPEYFQKFGLPEPQAGPAAEHPPARCEWAGKRIAGAGGGGPSAPPSGNQGFVADQELFYFWRSDTVLRFVVYRGQPFECDGDDEQALKNGKPVSTVISIVPGISLHEIAPQLDGDIGSARSWKEFCDQPERGRIKIKYCAGPDGRKWPGQPQDQTPSGGGQDGPGLSCTALAHVLEDRCDKRGTHPNFPQDSFIWQTLHDPYTTYAAYFDLGRHLVRRAMSYCKEHPKDCAGP